MPRVTWYALTTSKVWRPWCNRFCGLRSACNKSGKSLLDLDYCHASMHFSSNRFSMSACLFNA